jgi:hypothetical protein
VTTKEERLAREKLLAALAAYKAAHSGPLRPEAQTVLDTLSNTKDTPTIEAFNRIMDLWPAKPVRPPVYEIPPDPPDEPSVLRHLIDGGALSEFKRKKRPRLPIRSYEWYSPIDALASGLTHRASVVERMGRERRALAAVEKASEALDAVQLLVRKLNDNGIRDAYDELERHLAERVGRAESYVGAVKREVKLPERFGLNKDTGELGLIALDGWTREGMRLAVARIRSIAPKATNEDIETVLATVFNVPRDRDDASGEKLVDVKALVERRPKSEKVKAREKAARAPGIAARKKARAERAQAKAKAKAEAK